MNVSGSIKEPVFNPLTSDRIGLIKGLNFYSSNYDYAESKKWALDWVKKNKPNMLSIPSGLKDSDFTNLGFLCRMMERGFSFSKEEMEKIERSFQDLSKLKPKKRAESAVQVKQKTALPNVKPNPCLQSLNEVIDSAIEGKEPPPLSLNDKKDDVKKMVEYCDRTIAEMTESEEYYSPDTIRVLRPLLRKCREQGMNMLKALEQNKTVTIAPKKINPIAMVKGVRFKKEEKALGIKSVPVTSVIGARKMYAYDTQTRKLRLYVSNSAQGFMFSGTTLKNYDPEKSVCKTIRKPEAFFAQFASGITMRAINNAFKALTTVESKIESGGRFNENLIILKVASE
jgi:hypothetical protein